MIAPVLLSVRWWILARPLITWSEAFTFTWIGLFYGVILPGGVSGDVVKGGLLAWKNIHTRRASLPASILIDRVVGLGVMLSFFCISSLLVINRGASPALAHFALPAAVVGAVGICGLLLGFAPAFQHIALIVVSRIPWQGLRSQIQQFAESTFAYSKHRSRLLLAALVSATSQILGIAMYSTLLNALSIHFQLIPTFALYSIFAVLGMAPITIAGIGARDWFAVCFFSAYSLPPEAGVAFAWLCLAMSVLQASIGGLLQLAMVLERPCASISNQ
jgi:uncharacterized protein (TIRG00374 family)